MSGSEGNTPSCAARRRDRSRNLIDRAETHAMSQSPALKAALIVVDVQRAFDEWEAAGKRRNNPEAIARIADLLSGFRDRGAPVFHIRHQGTRPNSSFLAEASGYPVKDEAREIE